MPSRNGGRAARSRDDRGAAAVEFALLMPIGLVLLFGVISAGLAYFHKVGLATDVREGGRVGATYLTTAGMTADQDPAGFVSQVYQEVLDNAGDSGDLHMTNTSAPYSLATTDQLLCVAYIDASGHATRTYQGTAPLPANGGGCFTDGLAATGYPRVQVYATGYSAWNLVVMSGGPKVSYSSQAVYRYERS